MDIRTVTLDIDAIFSRHYTAALNDKTGKMADHWRDALDEVLAAAGVVVAEPVHEAEPEAESLKTAGELAAEKMERDTVKGVLVVDAYVAEAGLKRSADSGGVGGDGASGTASGSAAQ